MASSHSQSSSLSDVPYYTSYDNSRQSWLSNDSLPPPLPLDTHSRSQAQTYPVVRERERPPFAQHGAVPSFSAFRSQVSSIPVSSPSAARHKPAPLQGQLGRAASVAERASPRLVDPSTRPSSIASPVLQHHSGLSGVISPPLTEEPVPEDSPSKHVERPSVTWSRLSHTRTDSIDSRIAESHPSSSIYGDSRRSSIPIHARYVQEQQQHNTISHAPSHSTSSLDFASHYSPARHESRNSMNGTQLPPSMNLELEGVPRSMTDDSLSSTESPSHHNGKTKSPGGRFGGLFAWKGSSQHVSTESPTTTFSDRSLSPLLSPAGQKRKHDSPNGLTPPGLDIHKANASSSPRAEYFDNMATPILIGTPESHAHVKELERELAHISTELAGSIRREMDLEDEVERLRTDIPALPHTEGYGRRSSDYFSDSGASSTRWPVTDVDAKIEQLEGKLRKVEQERAQSKLETAARIQSELSRRHDLEQMVQNMEEQLQKSFDDGGGLESTLEDTRRLLHQERQAKGSFEDLYHATREEVARHVNERDNLRDEVVPLLRRRVEGLEAEGMEKEQLVHENTRMGQELVGLREKVQGRIGSIAEESSGRMSPTVNPRMGLSRSGSKRGGSLTRSGSVVEGRVEGGNGGGGRHRSGSLNGDAVKEMEDQRDALHKALKLLISRHEKQRREHERAVKKLTSARTVAENVSPNRTAYHKEVTFLKDEVATLRKRTEDALEQKWQYEKGLSGIKMDLDRAELETRGLRIILQEHDILAPSTRTLVSDDEGEGEGEGGSTDQKLEISISTAESERDQARQMAEEYRSRASECENDEDGNELLGSARRMDELADELDKQVQANLQLRARLAEAVAKGEREQKESSGKIQDMQKRLTVMEDSALEAQQHSETTLGTHETEVRRLEEASSPSLQRLTIAIPEAQRTRSTSPMLKSPHSRIGGWKEASLLESGKTRVLERRVRELEGLLREAEGDMQAVVQRVNRSQIEVAELSEQRDAACCQMRKLQGLILVERERAEGIIG